MGDVILGATAAQVKNANARYGKALQREKTTADLVVNHQAAVNVAATNKANADAIEFGHQKAGYVVQVTEDVVSALNSMKSMAVLVSGRGSAATATEQGQFMNILNSITNGQVAGTTAASLKTAASAAVSTTAAITANSIVTNAITAITTYLGGLAGGGNLTAQNKTDALAALPAAPATADARTVAFYTAVKKVIDTSLYQDAVTAAATVANAMNHINNLNIAGGALANLSAVATAVNYNPDIVTTVSTSITGAMTLTGALAAASVGTVQTAITGSAPVVDFGSSSLDVAYQGIGGDGSSPFGSGGVMLYTNATIASGLQSNISQGLLGLDLTTIPSARVAITTIQTLIDKVVGISASALAAMDKASSSQESYANAAVSAVGVSENFQLTPEQTASAIVQANVDLENARNALTSELLAQIASSEAAKSILKNAGVI